MELIISTNEHFAEVHRDSIPLRDFIPGETERKPQQNARLCRCLFSVIADKPLFRGGSSCNSLPFACSSTVKLLSFSLGGWPICRPKKTANGSRVLWSFSLFSFFFFKGSLIFFLIHRQLKNFYYSIFKHL